MNPIDKLRAAFPDAQRSGEWFKARCKAHDDRKASLNFRERPDGSIQVKCHAGCSTDDVLASVGMTKADLKKSSFNIVHEYSYIDENGAELFQCVRLEPKDFRQRHKDEHGKWQWNLNGQRRVLYKLPQLIAAVKQGKTIFVVEGEKDVATLHANGIAATCNPMGAGKWSSDYNESLRGANVVILPDNDDAGRKHAAQVAASLSGVAASLKIVELPNLPSKGDVSDYFAAGGTVEGLLELVEAAQELPKGDVLQSTATNIEPTVKRATVKKSSAGNTPVNVEVKPSKIAEIEAFLSRRYEFRFNVVTGKIEFRTKEQTLDGDAKPIEGTPFKVATEYDMNSLERELLHSSLPARSLTKLLSSDFVPTFNPFTDFLDGLPQWNGERDFIAEFFNATVKVKLTDGEDSQSIAAEYFRKWLVATVSTWRGTGNIREINQTMLIFTGAQGRGKTTWQLNLMPDALREYVYAGHFDASNRDNLVLLADKGIIIFDELDALNRGGEAAFKQAISKAFITARRAYGRSNEDYPRRASFIGSINHTEFLGDTTGTRRFLTVEVESIDNELVKTFPLEMVYAQAKALLDSGFRYWFDSSEVAALNERNARHATISVEEDLILSHFTAGEVFYTPTAIVEALSAKYKSVRINPVAIGKILKKHGYERTTRRVAGKPLYGYLGRLAGLGEAFPQGGDPF